MLGWRLFLSAILIPALVGLFCLDALAGQAAPVLLVLCVLLAVRGCWEMADLLATRSFEPDFRATAFLSSAVILAGWAPLGSSAHEGHALRFAARWESMALVLAAAVLLLFLKGVMRYRAPGKSLETLGAELLIVGYLGLLLAITAQLRWLPDGSAGYIALGSLIAAAKCGDIGAYTLGRLFGKKKMAPHLSPGKTWMGAVGALAGAALGAWLWAAYGPPVWKSEWRPGWGGWFVLYGVIIGLTGLVGDLCESLIKRDVGRKDSAALLPGFGGLLDLLDSVIYAGPVAYLLWRTLPLTAAAS